MVDAERPAGGPLLEMRGISKTFGGIRALDGVSLSVDRGEIHGLLGENGSGKSTLIKILAGFHVPDRGGELTINGRPVGLPLVPGQFRELGMRFVHQDLGLVATLSALENFRVDELVSGSHWRISWRKERCRVLEIFEQYRIDIDPDALVGNLRPVDRALLAIVRAVSGLDAAAAKDDRNGGLLVLDEPTVFLPKVDVEALFELVRRVARRGSSVVLVSHDLDEVRQITDRVTVLRDGRVHGTVETARTTATQLIEMIIGRPLDALASRTEHPASGTRRVAVAGLTGASIRDATFEIRSGEILGVTGLVGSGFEDLPYLLFGATPAEAGTLTVDGVTHEAATLAPGTALRAGLALIPADRPRDGAVGTLSVADNVSLQVLDRYRRTGILRRRALLEDARGHLATFDVRPGDPALTYASLSGGNQQKVLLAKWLLTEPNVLLLHEPTQGVDIGARQEIFGVLRSAVAAGMAALCASSDYEQLELLCDRVLIVAGGSIVSQLSGADVTKERITEQCLKTSAGLHRTGVNAE
jgi:ribose transport system ATP-binding protein